MGNTQANRNKKKDWWLDNTCAGSRGCKWKTLNKIRKPGESNFSDFFTSRLGWRPLIVDLTPQGWILCDKVSVEGKQLRVVEIHECGSFGNLIRQYGFCLVTYATNPVSSQSWPIISNSLVAFGGVLWYLGLITFCTEDGRTYITVIPHDNLTGANPTWEHKGRNAAGYELFEIFAPVKPKSSFNAGVQNYCTRDHRRDNEVEGATTYLACKETISGKNTKWMIV